MKPKVRAIDRAWILLYALYVAYAARFLYIASGFIDGHRWLLPLDDVMVSMDYARNLVSGHGLVWTPGSPRIEGFSDPLWTFYMALLQRLPDGKRWALAGIMISGGLCILACLAGLRRLGERLGAGPEVALAAGILSAAFFPLNYWALMGMEVGLFAALTVWGACLALEEAPSRWQSACWWTLIFLFPWLRMDGALPAAILVLAWALKRRDTRAALFWGWSFLALSLGSQFLARQIYYHEWMPNTYYLKLAGIPVSVRWTRGIYVLLRSALSLGWGWPLLALAGALLRRNATVLLCSALILGALLYSVHVGGDAWEDEIALNRFVSSAAPLLLLLLAVALGCAAARLAGSSQTLKLGLLSVFVLASLWGMNARGEAHAAASWALQESPPGSADMALLVQGALIARQKAAPDAKIAVLSAGHIPYFSEHPCIDLLGRCDPWVARLPLPPDILEHPLRYHPGHDRYDLLGSVQRERPDVVLQIKDPAPGMVDALLGLGYHMEPFLGASAFVRNGSAWQR